MSLFAPDTASKSARHRAIYAAYEMAFTVVDFLAAILFTVGSVLFFWASWQTIATWCFVLGSVCFLLKPTIRLIREVQYLSVGDVDEVADKLSV